jgi:hypothetical protein
MAELIVFAAIGCAIAYYAARNRVGLPTLIIVYVLSVIGTFGALVAASALAHYFNGNPRISGEALWMALLGPVLGLWLARQTRKAVSSK